MITITQYAITPRTSEVRVEYTYLVRDSIANQDIERGNAALLGDGAGKLADAKWGNEELAAALAERLGVDAALVTVAAA